MTLSNVYNGNKKNEWHYRRVLSLKKCFWGNVIGWWDITCAVIIILNVCFMYYVAQWDDGAHKIIN